MAVTLEEFKDYVGTKDSTGFPQECLTSGEALITRLIGEAENVPTAIRDQAVLIASSELFHRRSAPNGISQFADATGNPVRVGRDPLSAVYPLVLPYIQFGV